jgi:hypothetical protein
MEDGDRDVGGDLAKDEPLTETPWNGKMGGETIVVEDE